jgi:hypothetical protein
MTPPAPARNFTRDDLQKWLDEKTLTAAEGYVRAVSQLHVSDAEASALVQGTDPRPYTVRVVFQPGKRGGTQVNMHCTCPTANACKHCGAVLLSAIEQRGEAVLRPDPQVLAWLKDLRELVGTPERKVGAKNREQLFYLLHHSATKGHTSITLHKARMRSDGTMPPDAPEWNNIERALLGTPEFVTEEDSTILRLLWLANGRSAYFSDISLRGHRVDDLLPRMLATGRCHLAKDRPQVLRSGPPRVGHLTWKLLDDGLTHSQVSVPDAANAIVLATEPPWYILPDSGQAGPLDTGLAARLANRLLNAPALRPVDAAVVARELTEIQPSLPRPDVHTLKQFREIRTRPRLRLTVNSRRVDTLRNWRGYMPLQREWIDFAYPVFDYAGLQITLDEQREFHMQGKEVVRLVRDAKEEAAALRTLAELGFEQLPQSLFPYWAIPQEAHLYALENEAGWSAWISHILPNLRLAGWSIELKPDFRHHVLDAGEFSAEVSEGPEDSVKLNLGYELEGQRLPLAPLLAGLLREQPRLVEPGMLDALPENHAWVARLDDGRRVRVAMGRLKPILRNFIDLFDGSDTLRVSRLDQSRFEGLDQTINLAGLQALGAAREYLGALVNTPPVPQPEGFGMPLRPYQLQGLAWLQTLRTLNLGGILADDMGLGKTAQTLAHILTEKLAGRLDKPALVIVPTSLVFNWREEATRVAPALSIHILHGPQRDFTAIDSHDLVLTTYPLVWRDAEELAKHEYHLLILDEAQTVKNAESKAAGVIRGLTTRHRLCLTGTPMENHLGELWALFDFLLPGFLGSNKEFLQSWRTPIEKHGDELRRDLLARRVRPFILRRRKDEVARELPPKSIMVRNVELAGDQRDLYETVRAAMDTKVREEISAKGVDRSQIMILDALLKLRQVCCDPRLLSLESAQQIKEHAKLDFLMDMLPELLAEGHRVLLFSQFTSMLDLIVEALNAAAIPHVKLTGQTQDRESVVKRFQSGEVPLFLISLKAGGVGLNLTAADTVIHFDPWWNPATEDQATDRAHRIGQTKPVFVYKLIAAGSIEERIVALQEKKSALAAALLSGDTTADVKFSADDLTNLLQPLN